MKKECLFGKVDKIKVKTMEVNIDHLTSIALDKVVVLVYKEEYEELHMLFEHIANKQWGERILTNFLKNVEEK